MKGAPVAASHYAGAWHCISCCSTSNNSCVIPCACKLHHPQSCPLNPAPHLLHPSLAAGTGLYELWKKGLYRNYPPDKLVDLVARILALVPPWVRIYRIQRDIPMPLVTSGVEKGNLRELALARMAHLGLRCR